MNIGETIKKLRREKDMTQEQLAEYLNITTQAVSKWETGLSLPDITLVPMLANIFDTSADVLLGVDIDAKEKRIQEIIENSYEYMRKGYNIKGTEILREGLKEYPNSYKLIHLLITSIWSARGETDNAQKRDEMTKEVIHLSEKILAECTDEDYKYSAIQLLCFTYPEIGEVEKAIALAKKMPPSFLSSENLLVNIYNGTKRFEIMRKNIFQHIYNIITDVTCNKAPLDDGNIPYTTEELITIYKKVISLIELMIEDGNYGFLRQTMAWKHIEIAFFYALLKQYDSVIEYLKIASKHAIINDEEFDPNNEYTCLLFKGMKYGGVHHNTINNDSLHQLEEMKNPVFDPIRERADFIEIEEELKKHAKKH